MKIQCFLCEEAEDNQSITSWYIYQQDPQQIINICSECTNQLGEIEYIEPNWVNRITKCSLCKEKIILAEWNSDPKGVFLDLWKNNRYYRICKCCWDKDISLDIDNIAAHKNKEINNSESL